MTINQTILQKLLNTKSKLSSDAIDLIQSFVQSQKHPEGGFVDRSGNPDPYYSVFGYTLSYIFDIELDINSETFFCINWNDQNKPDFAHAVSLLRCFYLLKAMEQLKLFGEIAKPFAKSVVFQNLFGKKIAKKLRKKHKNLLKTIIDFQSKDQGFNHLIVNAEYATVYANFLAFGLFEDLYFSENLRKAIAKSSMQLMLENGSFVNHPNSKQGVSSTTAAGLILLKSIGCSIFEPSEWLKKQIQPHGGFLAGEDVPVADVLSTATSLLAMEVAKTANDQIKKKAVEFVNLHWDDSGGFFGSIADQIPDVEYTFYGLLTIGV